MPPRPDAARRRARPSPGRRGPAPAARSVRASVEHPAAAPAWTRRRRGVGRAGRRAGEGRAAGLPAVGRGGTAVGPGDPRIPARCGAGPGEVQAGSARARRGTGPRATGHSVPAAAIGPGSALDRSHDPGRAADRPAAGGRWGGTAGPGRSGDQDPPGRGPDGRLDRARLSNDRSDPRPRPAGGPWPGPRSASWWLGRGPPGPSGIAGPRSWRGRPPPRGPPPCAPPPPCDPPRPPCAPPRTGAPDVGGSSERIPNAGRPPGSDDATGRPVSVLGPVRRRVGGPADPSGAERSADEASGRARSGFARLVFGRSGFGRSGFGDFGCLGLAIDGDPGASPALAVA